MPEITKDNVKTKKPLDKERNKNLDLYKSKSDVFRNVPPNMTGLYNSNRSVQVGNSYTKFHARALRTVKTTGKSGVNVLSGITALFDTTGNSMRRIIDKMQAYAKEHCDQVDKFREVRQKEKEQAKAQRSANIETMRSNIMSGMMVEYQRNNQRYNDGITLDPDTLDEINRVERKSKEQESDDFEYDN